VFPNPANARTTVSLGLDIEEEPIDVILKVYDLKGMVVKTLRWNQISNPIFEK